MGNIFTCQKRLKALKHKEKAAIALIAAFSHLAAGEGFEQYQKSLNRLKIKGRKHAFVNPFVKLRFNETWKVDIQASGEVCETGVPCAS